MNATKPTRDESLRYCSLGVSLMSEDSKAPHLYRMDCGENKMPSMI